MKRMNKWIALATVVLLASCAGENAMQPDEQKENTTPTGYTSFVSGTEAATDLSPQTKATTAPEYAGQPRTRTSIDYATGNYFWENGDKIYIKDDDGQWRSATVSGNKLYRYQFQLPGRFTQNSYTVFYPGKNGTNDQVSIPSTQTQTQPGLPHQLGESGDCGIATATLKNGVYFFRINHKAAILVLQPYSTEAIFRGCKLTRIEVISNNNIAGTYTLNPTTEAITGTGSGKMITINTPGTDGTGFTMNTATPNAALNAAYVVIAPGRHKLQVRYWLKNTSTTDPSQNVEGCITKNLPEFTYEANDYYDMTANLNPVYPSNNYFTWDTRTNLHYWHGYEWDNVDPTRRRQPTRNNATGASYPADAPWSNTNPRGYNPAIGFTGGTNFPQATFSAKNCPNINEAMWYAKSDNWFDESEIWATMGRIYKGGMWFRKKENIPGFRSDRANDNNDYRRLTSINMTKTNSTFGKPGSDLDKYFFIPATGRYHAGKLDQLGECGRYWLSTPQENNTTNAYRLFFSKTEINITANSRPHGYKLWTAQ